MKMRLIFALYVTQFVSLSQAFWWPFSSTEENSEKAPVTSLQSVFAPFEVTEVETKFLAEAAHYLGNLPKLDQCNLLIINRLRSSCNKMTEVDVSKLSVNLLNCQSAVEGRKVFKCTDDMALSDCTRDMDSDTWNAYHVISNRARAVCYSVRQTEFRVKTELTINSLANSARDNLANLKHLLTGQEDLSNKTSETLNKVIDGNDKFVQVQTELNSQQNTLKEAISDNINSLSREKKMITSRQELMMKHSRDVKNDLVSLATEIKRHHAARKYQDKELLGHVEAIQHRAKDVLEKLDLAVKNMDSHYDRIEKRHGKIIENVQDIQKAINFISEVIVNFEDTFHNHMRWINDTVGGTRDKLSVISVLLGHIIHFFILIFTMIFVGSPVISRGMLLLLLPLNCISALQNKKNFTHKEMALIIAVTYPAHWVYCFLKKIYIKHGRKFFSCKIKILRRMFDKFVLRKCPSEEQETFVEEDTKGCEEINLTNEDYLGQSLLTSTPDKQYKRRLYLNSEESPGHTPRRCGSLTRTGQRCKSFCRRGNSSCSRHENSYNSYFEETNINA